MKSTTVVSFVSKSRDGLRTYVVIVDGVQRFVGEAFGTKAEIRRAALYLLREKDRT